MNKKIGIIGYGNMGSAIAERLKDICDICVFDKDPVKLRDIQKVNICGDAVELAAKAEIIILAVKPQDFDALLEEIKGSSRDKLMISIAAGISTRYIEKKLGEMRVVRVMPNLPAKIGRGMSCISKGKFARDEDLEFVRTLFERLGRTMVIKEKMMDAATAVAGSGPAFYCDFLASHPKENHEKLRKEFVGISIATAQKDGFTPEEAKLVVESVVAGTDALLHEMKLTPIDLEKQVASRGGTTEAGLKAFYETGSVEEAYKAAKKRAEELSKKE